ncbi:uncharacterized protein LOC115397473 isoform X2 [Salarias fasciatus]|uniref:uncharacterized protein LOC115397473 isoform X2 n=1 Tax=Salarias fasciatus TaxID=181472 RepID=UPI0011770794|nr:uncharacterized protein LOC115397473 isoform X2 [Salarias fasciatus]
MASGLRVTAELKETSSVRIMGIPAVTFLLLKPNHGGTLRATAGTYRQISDPWIWSDGSNSSFRFWKSSQPNYRSGQNCTAAVFRDGGRWNDLRCSGRRDFVCYGARKSTPATANSRSTTAATFATNYTTTLTPLPMTSSEEVGETSDFYVSTDEPTTTTEVFTTTAETSATGPTAPSTTQLESLAWSTDLSEATAKTPDATATQPGFTVSVSTETASASATHMKHKGQNTTQVTGHIRHSGSVILIQKNMTWIEAMSYCREHHVDLVHVTTEGLQEEVAERAKHATSAHVWLGLRYTCKFNFWFWIRSVPGCFQNWAPGHGPGREYDCGASGAAEATGRQQWVGLPETEKLNFLCSLCAG